MLWVILILSLVNTALLLRLWWIVTEDDDLHDISKWEDEDYDWEDEYLK